MCITILGLALDILGVWFLAYEIIFKQPMRLKVEISMKHVSNLETTLKQLKKIWDLPSPPYTPEEIDKFQKDLDIEYSKKIEAQKEIIDEYGVNHEKASFKYAAIGLFMITLGFIFQIIGQIYA